MARSPIRTGYQPLTWQSVNTAPMGQAISAFDSGAANASKLAADLFGLQDRLDKQLTNRLLASVTRTGELPTQINPRADAKELYEAANTFKTDRSNLETADVTRRKMGLESDLLDLEIEDYPAKIERLEAEHQAKLADIEARKQANQISAARAETERQALEWEMNQARSVGQYESIVGRYRQGQLPGIIETLREQHPDWGDEDIQQEAAGILDADVSRKFDNYFFAGQMPEGSDLSARSRSSLGTTDALSQKTAAEIAVAIAGEQSKAASAYQDAVEGVRNNPANFGIRADGSFYADSKNKAVSESTGRSILTQATVDADGNSYLNFDSLEGDLKTSFYDAVKSFSPSVVRRLAENTHNAITETGGERSTERFAKEFRNQARLLRSDMDAWVDEQLGQGGVSPGDRLNAALTGGGEVGGTNEQRLSALVPRIEDILKKESGTDSISLDLQVHPDRVVSATDISRLTNLVRELETKRKNGEVDNPRAALSAKQLADRRRALDQMLEALSTAPPVTTDLNQFGSQFFRDPIESKL